MRSNVARRKSVRRSAGAAGAKPCDSSLARINRSMSVWGHDALAVTGVAGLRTG
jgi:hypothetical protein